MAWNRSGLRFWGFWGFEIIFFLVKLDLFGLNLSAMCSSQSAALHITVSRRNSTWNSNNWSNCNCTVFTNGSWQIMIKLLLRHLNGPNLFRENLIHVKVKVGVGHEDDLITNGLKLTLHRRHVWQRIFLWHLHASHLYPRTITVEKNWSFFQSVSIISLQTTSWTIRTEKKKQKKWWLTKVKDWIWYKISDKRTNKEEKPTKICDKRTNREEKQSNITDNFTKRE
jgi:hypothetical protein